MNQTKTPKQIADIIMTEYRHQKPPQKHTVSEQALLDRLARERIEDIKTGYDIANGDYDIKGVRIG